MPPCFADAEGGHWGERSSFVGRDNADLRGLLTPAGAPRGRPEGRASAAAVRRRVEARKPDGGVQIEVRRRSRCRPRGIRSTSTRRADRPARTRCAGDRYPHAELVASPPPASSFIVLPERTTTAPTSRTPASALPGTCRPRAVAVRPPPSPAGKRNRLPKGVAAPVPKPYTPDGTPSRTSRRSARLAKEKPRELATPHPGRHNNRFRIPAGRNPHYAVNRQLPVRRTRRLISLIPTVTSGGRAGIGTR